MIIRQGALAHERMRYRDAKPIHQGGQFGGRIRQHDTAARINQRLLGAEKRGDDFFRHCLIQRGFGVVPRVRLDPVEEGRVELRGENIHRHRDQHRAGATALRQMKCLIDDLGKRSARSTRQARFTNGR